MAHDEATRRQVRSAYIFDGLDLPAAAAHGVPESTARNWKRAALAAGDDWDRARSAQLLAGGSIEEVQRQTLAAMIRQVQATVRAIETDAEMPPAIKTQLLASCTDSMAKATAAMRRMMPEVDAQAERVKAVKILADFVRDHHPDHYGVFGDILAAASEAITRG